MVLTALHSIRRWHTKESRTQEQSGGVVVSVSGVHVRLVVWYLSVLFVCMDVLCAFSCCVLCVCLCRKWEEVGFACPSSSVGRAHDVVEGSSPPVGVSFCTLP